MLKFSKVQINFLIITITDVQGTVSSKDIFETYTSLNGYDDEEHTKKKGSFLRFFLRGPQLFYLFKVGLMDKKIQETLIKTKY